MSARRLFTGLFIISFFWIVSCNKELIGSGYPTVVLSSISPGESPVFSAELIKDKYTTVDETGFIWQMDDDPLNKAGFEIKSTVSDHFSATVTTSLVKGRIYTVRAYARCGDHNIYSDIMNFTAN